MRRDGALHSIRGVWRHLLDPLLPRSCWSCGRPCGARGALCDACTHALPWLDPALRPAAGLDAAWAGLAFEGPARSLVHALKFRGALGVAGLMAAQLVDRAPPGLLAPGRVLVPVPAHPGRRRRRGFDPAQLLARELGLRTGLPVTAALVRGGGPGAAQRGAGRAARLAGEHLEIGARRPVAGAAVLVDDVWTTGATLRACARALRAAGAGRVSAVAYARASGGRRARATIRASPSPEEWCPMQIDVKGLNVPVTDELREQIEKRFGTIAKQVAELATLDVILSEERNPAIKADQKAEANLRLKGVTLNAKAHASEMRAAIAEVAEELQRQVARHREKVRGHRKVGTPSIRTATPEEA